MKIKNLYTSEEVKQKITLLIEAMRIAKTDEQIELCFKELEKVCNQPMIAEYESKDWL